MTPRAEGDRKTEYVQLRLTPAQFERIRLLALIEADGNVSELLRELVEAKAREHLAR